MKIRTSFVSNSSSSSYIVDRDLTKLGIRCVPIDADRLESLAYYINLCKLDSEPQCTLSGDAKWYATRSITEYERPEIYDALRSCVHYEYLSGGIGGTPYDAETDTDELYCDPGEYADDDVYIRKEHTRLVVMRPTSVAQLIERTYPNAKFVEAYERNGHIEIYPIITKQD